jgi:deoxyribodipyrimidine photo-lyase
MVSSVLWFRRDLRLRDNPALSQAAASGDTVVPLFVIDPALWQPAGPPRRSYLLASLASLRRSIGGLVVRVGEPADQVAAVVAETGAASVHIAADFGPYGVRRDAAVESRLNAMGVPLERTGSSYAVDPGSLLTAVHEPFRVFTPFFRAWSAHGWPEPTPTPTEINWSLTTGSADLRAAGLSPGGLLNAAQAPDESLDGMGLPPAGEGAAQRRWVHFLQTRLEGYGALRNRPDLDATSRLSVHLKWGELHPRTLLADLTSSTADARSTARFRTELAWREFYADVLYHHPASARQDFRPEFASLPSEEPGDHFAAWCAGRTGYPIVDAGMRQLRSEGWMHNRVRMIVASFLVKDLHIAWQHGARHFMRWLVDGDLASNMHGWQWTAGSGTDPAPYFRVFNPVEQGKKFDPDGAYIRRYVSELRDVAAPQIHEPRNPIVDHAAERKRSMAAYESLRDRPPT